jgi:hypothetical protein
MEMPDLKYMPEFDYKKQIQLRRKAGFIPISASCSNGRIINITYIPIKVLEKIREKTHGTLRSNKAKTR